MAVAQRLPSQTQGLGQFIGEWKIREIYTLAYYIWGIILTLLGLVIIIFSARSLLFNDGGSNALSKKLM